MAKSLLRKIATKTVYGDIPLSPKTKGRVMKVIGIVNSSKEVATPFDSVATKFIGQFRAVNLETGEEFTAFNMYLPEPASGMLLAGISDAKLKDPTASIKFGFEIGYQPDSDKRNARGYQFTCVPLIETDSGLSELDHLVKDDIKALPAGKSK